METASSEITWIIIAGAILTYMARFGGHVVLSRFKSVPPRVLAALDAVPAAVMTTLFAPVALTNGWPEAIAMGLVLLVGLRFNMTAMLVTACVSIVALRHLFG
ncbi:MAG: membrane protein [Rhizobiaceae bacterium MnEN-MB40S]|nr:MAG: membrane protein [Rhizobiaceae bacterium MnEN-MB40S]